MNVKLICSLLIVALMAGCASTGNVDSRKKERYSAYASLSQEMKEAVDHSSIKVGMPKDAVYIAWGKPDQVLQSGNASGETTTWVYIGGYLEETRYWGYRRIYYDYNPRTYVKAEVLFKDDKVLEWHTLPQPAY